MENKLHKQNTHTCMPNNSHPPPTLAMHKDSKKISKITKPKIRIIHVFAPQIIKTDVANFRELVQRKTGKPSGAEKMCYNINKKPTILAASSGTDQDQYSSRKSNGTNSLISGLSDDDDDDDKPNSKNKKMELRSVKEEQVCSDEIFPGGYLGGFSDLEEGFISELGGFPLLPLDCNHAQGFEESRYHLQ